MKKFTIVGNSDREDRHLHLYVVAMDSLTVNAVAELVFPASSSDFRIFSGFIEDVVMVNTETPEEFYTRCTAWKGSIPQNEPGRSRVFAVQAYTTWYEASRDQITQFLTGGPSIAPGRPQLFPDFTVGYAEESDGGTPRMRPWIPPFGGPRRGEFLDVIPEHPIGTRKPLLEIPELPEDQRYPDCQIGVNGVIRVEQETDGTVHLGTVNRQELIRSLQEPTIHIDSEPPTYLQHYWMVGRGGTAVGIQIRRDGEIVTNRFQTIFECLQAFAVEYPDQTLMIFGDNDMFAWFNIDARDGKPLESINQVSIGAYGCPGVRPDAEIVRFVKSTNIYQLFAVAQTTTKEYKDQLELLNASEIAVLDRDAPVPSIAVMIEKIEAIDKLRPGYKSLTLDDAGKCPYVVSNHYPSQNQSTMGTRTPHGWFNTLLGCLSSVFVSRREYLVVHNDTVSGCVVWLQYNEYHQVPSVHYYSNSVRDDQVYDVLRFCRGLEIIRRLAILTEMIRKKDLK